MKNSLMDRLHEYFNFTRFFELPVRAISIFRAKKPEPPQSADGPLTRPTRGRRVQLSISGRLGTQQTSPLTFRSDVAYI